MSVIFPGHREKCVLTKKNKNKTRTLVSGGVNFNFTHKPMQALSEF